MLSFVKLNFSEKTLFFIFIFIFILLSSFLYSIIINVPADQPTIQDGIDAALNGDTVLVQPGTYGENINFDGKLITVGSLFLTTQDAIYISTTIINGNNNGSIVTFENLEDSTSILTGFTIANGSGTGVDGKGGGISCWYSSSPSLMNITITGNFASFGGGIYCYDNSSPSLVNVTISNNSAEYYGGGMLCDINSSPTLQNVTISGNSAFGACGGAGMLCDYSSSPILKNVTITGNYALEQYGSGGGIFCTHDSNPSLENVTITDNHVDNVGGGVVSWGSHPVLINSILWNDLPYEIHTVNGGLVTITYSDIENGSGFAWFGNGCLDLDPIFEDPDYGNYYLQSNSPCIDAGDPTSPLNPDGTFAEMGAYFFDQTLPHNVTIEIIGTDVHLSWDAVASATSYMVYSSDDPYTGFVEETTGAFNGTSWSTSVINEKRFYYVTAIN